MRVIRVLPYAAVLLALSGTAACSAGSGTTPPPATTPAAAKTLSVTVSGTSVTPAPVQVDLGVGQTLVLTITVDHDDVLHAHGFEVEQELKKGVPTQVVIVGAEPGSYEVETHEPALTLLTVAVR